MLEIKKITGEVRLRFDAIPEGMKGKFSLSEEDYIVVPFSLSEAINFEIGDYVDLSEEVDEALGGLFAKRYEIISLQTPTYNKETGGYDYQLRLDAYYMKWQNKLFRYEPLTGGQETSWNLTAALDVHMGEFLKNLEALGYRFNNESYGFEIDETVEDAAKLVSYDSTNLIDALTEMAQTWDCEWWVTEKTIHFGKCEHSEAVKLELDEEVEEMTRQESKGTYATRIYAFGAARNLPTSYRQVDETVVVNGVVQRRLMLPEDTPYIDAYRYEGQKKIYIEEEGYGEAEEMPEEEAIEAVVATDDIYPRTQCEVGSVGSYLDTVEDEETAEKTTQIFYYVTDTSGLKFDEDYILEGEELMMKFESGLLNGMEFGVRFRKKGSTLKGETLTEDVYEIVANEDYGRMLPDDTLKPQEKDKFILFNWDSTKIEELGLVDKAEQELKQYAIKYIKKTMVDDGTYSVKLMSDWVKKDMMEHTFSVGQKVNLINKAFFPDGRLSRILGFEIKLDFSFDAPQYLIGESIAYSRLGNIEDKIEALTYKGSTYKSYGSSGSSIYLIKRIDETAASETNAYSALRALMMFLRKDQADTMPYDLTIEGIATFIKMAIAKNGMQFGQEFNTGLLGDGAQVDALGNAEFESVTIRRFLEVPELRYNRVTVMAGTKWYTNGGGLIESVEILSDTTGRITLKLDDGDYGQVSKWDICMGIFHDYENEENNWEEDSSDDRQGNMHFKGFSTVYFYVTDVSGSRNEIIEYELRTPDVGWSLQNHPCNFMEFASYGNFYDEDRQDSRYTTPGYEVWLRGVNTWMFDEKNRYLLFGKLDGFTLPDGSRPTGTGGYMENIYYSGTILQIKNEPYVLEVTTDLDNLLVEGDERIITVDVTKLYKSYKEEVNEWSVVRTSKDKEEDEKWNLSKEDYKGEDIRFKYSDFGETDYVLLMFTAKIKDSEDDSEKTITSSICLRMKVDGEDAYNIESNLDNVIFAQGELNAPTIQVMLYKGKEQVDMPDYQTNTGLKWSSSTTEGLKRNDFWVDSEGFKIYQIVLSRDSIERELSTDQTFTITLENGLVFTKTIHISTVFDGEEGQDAYYLKSTCEVACFTESQNEITFTLTPYKGSTQIYGGAYYTVSSSRIDGITVKITSNTDGTASVSLTRDDPTAALEGTLRFGCEVNIANDDTMDIYCPVSVVSQFNGKDAAGTSIEIEQTEIAIRSSRTDETIHAWVYKNNEVYKISDSAVKVNTSEIPNGYPFFFTFEGVSSSGRINFNYSCMVFSKNYPLDAIIPVTFNIDAIEYVRCFHMYTVFDGEAAEKGEDAVTYELDCPVSIVKYQAAAGAFAPTSITATLYKIVGSIRTTYEGSIDFYAAYINDTTSERRLDGQDDVISYTIDLADHIGKYGSGYFSSLRVRATGNDMPQTIEKTIIVESAYMPRIQVWEDLEQGFQFESAKTGEMFLDFVYYTEGKTYFFQCVASHMKSEAEPKVGQTTAWWKPVNTFDNIATGVMLAQTAKIENLYVDDVYMEKGNTAIWISPLFEGMKIQTLGALENNLGRENQVDDSGNVVSAWSNPTAWFHGGNIPTIEGAFGAYVNRSLTCEKSSGYFIDNVGATRAKEVWNSVSLEIGTITGLTKGNQLSISTDDYWNLLFKEGTKVSGYSNSKLTIRIYFYWGSSTSAEHYLEGTMDLTGINEQTSVQCYIEKLAVKLDVEDESLRVVVCAYEGVLLPEAYVSFEDSLTINFKETAYKQVSQYGADGLMIGTSSESFLRLAMTSDKKDMSFELLGNSYGIMSEGKGLYQRTRGWDMPLGGTLVRAYIAPVSNMVNGEEKKTLWAYVWTFDGTQCAVRYNAVGDYTIYLPVEWVEKWGTFSAHKYVPNVVVCCKEVKCDANLWYNEPQSGTGRGRIEIIVFDTQFEQIDKPVYVSVELMGDYATATAEYQGDAVIVSLSNKK